MTEKGLWLGTIHACRDTVVESAIVKHKDSGDPVVLLTFSSAWVSALHQETEIARLTGSTFDVWLDGRLVAEPIVVEPITGPSIKFNLNSDEDVQAVWEASRRAC
jgi:hypothetical protein